MDAEAAKHNADHEDGDEPQGHLLSDHEAVMGFGTRIRRLVIVLVQIDQCMLRDMGVSLGSLHTSARRPADQPPLMFF
ncbi:hypothetical protein GA0070621_3565 [Micromonospora narathiwatensis]|uniref:Uncharacterized protein n=1 Tax=Micromonospora narathiwatensis TaxID=299146 RepID=A0A1A9A0Z8_9ACTN|nr:hypothetical protein GA0070621_3565 [Micromonospora narathiwatensis]